VRTTTNLILPRFFQSYTLGKYGPCFTIVMIGVVQHAIIRHRLMEVRVVIKRGAVYLAAFAVAGGSLVALLALSNTLGPDTQQVSWREIWLGLLVALVFQPLKERIQRAFDRYLYRQPYDYKQTISQASRALSTTIALPALLERLGNVVD